MRWRRRTLRGRTLRGRVSLLGLGVIAAWVVVVTVTFNLVLVQRLDHQAEVVLRTRALTAAATVALTPGGVSVRETNGDGELDSGLWVYAGARAIERPAGSARLDLITRSLATGAVGFHRRAGYRYYVLPVDRSGRRVATVVAAVSDAPYSHARDETLAGSALAALLVLLGAYPVLRFAAGRALRPVQSMTAQAGEWSAHGLDERFGADQRHAEMQALAATLDGVLDRLSAVVRHERSLSAELSHELRTPLARIVAETDLLLARPHDAAQLTAAHVAVRDSAMSTEAILETLLSAARIDVAIAPGRSDVDAVLRALGASRAARTDVVIEVHGEPGLTAGVNARVIERILAPLVDNATRYAVSSIELRAGRTAGAITVDVIDDGPGVPEQLRAVVFEPGRRARPDDGHDGAGLGLALSRRLARAAAGDVDLLDAGSTFRVTLPPA